MIAASLPRPAARVNKPAARAGCHVDSGHRVMALWTISATNRASPRRPPPPFPKSSLGKRFSGRPILVLALRLRSWRRASAMYIGYVQAGTDFGVKVGCEIDFERSSGSSRCSECTPGVTSGRALVQPHATQKATCLLGGSVVCFRRCTTRLSDRRTTKRRPRIARDAQGRRPPTPRRASAKPAASAGGQPDACCQACVSAAGSSG